MNTGLRQMTLGKRIRIAREGKNLSQAELARAIDVTRATISHWEKSSTKNASAMALSRAADVLGTSETYLLSGDEDSGHEFVAATIQWQRLVLHLPKKEQKEIIQRIREETKEFRRRLAGKKGQNALVIEELDEPLAVIKTKGRKKPSGNA